MGLGEHCSRAPTPWPEHPQHPGVSIGASRCRARGPGASSPRGLILSSRRVSHPGDLAANPPAAAVPVAGVTCHRCHSAPIQPAAAARGRNTNEAGGAAGSGGAPPRAAPSGTGDKVWREQGGSCPPTLCRQAAETPPAHDSQRGGGQTCHRSRSRTLVPCPRRAYLRLLPSCGAVHPEAGVTPAASQGSPGPARGAGAHRPYPSPPMESKNPPKPPKSPGVCPPVAGGSAEAAGCGAALGGFQLSSRCNCPN